LLNGTSAVLVYFFVDDWFVPCALDIKTTEAPNYTFYPERLFAELASWCAESASSPIYLTRFLKLCEYGYFFKLI